MALITCENLSLTIENQEILKDITFDVQQGDYVCVVGENGSGKSTLIKCILGLKSFRHGSITFGDGLTQRNIGYLPQKTDAQKNFPAGVEEVVLSGCLNQEGFHLFYTREQKQRAAGAMEQLRITDLKNQSFSSLSGGQQQRVLLARALCAADQVLILDEPVTGLDPVVTDDFYDMVYHLNREHGVTIIMVSHDLHLALRNATKILHLDTKMEFFGTPVDYLKSEAALDFLGREIHFHHDSGIPELEHICTREKE